MNKISEVIFILEIKTGRYLRQGQAWPTEDTAIYVTFWKQKLRGPMT